MADAAPTPLAPEQSAALAEFARMTKAAARSVSLYPATHPSIQGALQRVVAASTRLTTGGDVTLTIHPDAVAMEGRTSARPDPAVAEFAALLHDRLVGTLKIERGADAEDWHAFLLLLSRAPDDLFASGGIARALAATGRTRFEVREIDYAEVLRERAGSGEAVAWDRIVAFCLQGDGGTVDDASLAVVLEAIGDTARFGALLDRLDAAVGSAGAVSARAAALLKLLRTLADALTQRRPESVDTLLDTAAAAIGRLTPEMLLALIGQARTGTPEEHALVDTMISRVDDSAITTFVSSAVVAERGATARLAEAFEALVPEFDRKERLLQRAREDVEASPLGEEAGFEDLWRDAAGMLMSYSDKNYVSAEYGRELSGARGQAMEIERVSDDPPERVQAWLSTVSDSAIGDLDLALLLDLLRIEQEPEPWRAVAGIAAREIERRTVLGDVARMEPLLGALVNERSEAGRRTLRPVAIATIEALATGQLVRHVVLQLRKAEDPDVEPFIRLCHTIGPSMIRPLAEALTVEENNRAIRRLRELLLGFGAAGRQSVEQLKHSSNPAVRRTAIDLLRVFGGDEALPELASMLDDADPQVQRESIRAIVQIATPDAYAVLERTLVASRSARETILEELIAMRDDKAVPLLCHVLGRTVARGRLVQVHLQVMDALGALTGTAASTRTLRQVLYRGDWWAPMRTATLRHAAAAALRRIGTAESFAVLEEAVTTGPRGVRNAAKPHIGAATRRERNRA
jgi:hypothetical protein